MCRIDALFDVTSLDEKKDPIERFIQALDENKAEGKFRDFLIKHFSENWIDVFYNDSNLEEALSGAKEQESDFEKCIAILLSQKETIRKSILRYFKMYMLPVNDVALIGFLKDVVQTYFSGSPYGFFNAGMNKVESSYYLFVSWLYGEDYCFTQHFFDDKALSVLSERNRATIYWGYFYSITPALQSRGCRLDDKSLLKEFASIATLGFISGPPSEKSAKILRGLEFIKAWIKFDSQAGRLSYDWYDFAHDYNAPWHSIKDVIHSDGYVCEETSKLLQQWLNNTQSEFEKLLFVSGDLKQLSVEDSDKWASGFDSYFNSYIYTYIYSDFDHSQLTDPSFDERLDSAHNRFCSELTPLQISTWIKYSVKDDFQSVLNSAHNVGRHTLNSSVNKWCQEKYITAWKEVFLGSLNELDIENQLRILSSNVPCSRGQSGEFYSELSKWWDELFSNLIEQDCFPKNLIPDWTVSAVDRFNREDVFPYIDKSIGVLRGELTKTDSSEELEIYHQQLEKLFGGMDKLSPRKALRHRLLLMRSSKEPFSDESISKLGGLFERKNFQKWYDSLKHLADTHVAYQVNGNKGVTAENHSQVKNDFYIAFSHELAEFCLDRLRLRKGEKAIDNKYTANQIIEQSPIWRQGYLKALIELGFDLNGKVHKTVNFTKKSDPDASVRAIASQCYKEVRRSTKKSLSIQDIKRSIVAAEWWLLISQRQELQLGINSKEALKTRRNLMRNP
jgi:hypothetical protein